MHGVIICCEFFAFLASSCLHRSSTLTSLSSEILAVSDDEHALNVFVHAQCAVRVRYG